jgi:hypothetical protein
MARRAAATIALALDGSDASLAVYENENRDAFARYLRGRQAYYGSEARWPESPFWRRRHETRQDHLHRASTTHRNPTAPDRS